MYVLPSSSHEIDTIDIDRTGMSLGQFILHREIAIFGFLEIGIHFPPRPGCERASMRGGLAIWEMKKSRARNS